MLVSAFVTEFKKPKGRGNQGKSLKSIVVALHYDIELYVVF